MATLPPGPPGHLPMLNPPSRYPFATEATRRHQCEPCAEPLVTPLSNNLGWRGLCLTSVALCSTFHPVGDNWCHRLYSNFIKYILIFSSRSTSLYSNLMICFSPCLITIATQSGLPQYFHYKTHSRPADSKAGRHFQSGIWL